MASNEILTVERIGRADGEWGCMCPHCGKPIFFSEDDINDVRGSQYQHNGRTSWRTEERCEGWLEVSDDAKYSRIMFDRGDA